MADDKLNKIYENIKSSGEQITKNIKDNEVVNSISSTISNSPITIGSYGNKINDHMQEFFKKVNVFSTIDDVVSKANYKNEVSFSIANNQYNLTYKDRKITVLGLTAATWLVYSMRTMKIRPHLLRIVLPYYCLYSLLICRENLDPFL